MLLTLSQVRTMLLVQQIKKEKCGNAYYANKIGDTLNGSCKSFR